VDSSSAEGALVETSKAPRRVGAGRRVRGGVWGGYFYLLFDLKMERFGAVFKLDLTEETRMQLQEEEAIASSCLVLALPMRLTSALFLRKFLVEVSSIYY